MVGDAQSVPQNLRKLGRKGGFLRSLVNFIHVFNHSPHNYKPFMCQTRCWVLAIQWCTKQVWSLSSWELDGSEEWVTQSNSERNLWNSHEVVGTQRWSMERDVAWTGRSEKACWRKRGIGWDIYQAKKKERRLLGRRNSQCNSSMAQWSLWGWKINRGQCGWSKVSWGVWLRWLRPYVEGRIYGDCHRLKILLLSPEQWDVIERFWVKKRKTGHWTPTSVAFDGSGMAP